MKEKIKNIMAKVFNVSIEKITDDASPDSIASWDSLNHVNLIIALEQAFGVSFDANETIELLNYKLIEVILKEKGVTV